MYLKENYLQYKLCLRIFKNKVNLGIYWNKEILVSYPFCLYEQIKLL